MSAQRPLVSFDRFTPAQRRRAEALLLVALLYPTAPFGMSQAQLADWVAYGRAKSTGHGRAR